MTTTFADLGVPEPMWRALADRGIETPFPIQAMTIPDALAGRDLSGKAATGSGKTIAFGIPLLAGVERSAPKRPKGLVLVPTRELANQVAEELRMMAGELRILAVYGGARLEGQIKAMRRGVDVVVACPGRLGDLIERRVCDLRDVRFAVVDEADRMADMGFLPEVKRLLDQTRSDRQTLLFSATLDGAIDELVKRYQRNPVVHELPDEETGQVEHHFWKADRPAKLPLTAKIVKEAGRTIVFCRTRHGADRVAKQLGGKGVSAAAIHGDRSQSQRERALDAFHRGEVEALVATDVAARGIHVTGVQCVVHFDLPADDKDYVHRSGRTGRAGAVGLVVAFVDSSQHRDAAKIRRGAGVDAELVEPVPENLLAGAAERRIEAGVSPAEASPRRRSTAPTVADLAPARERAERIERAERPRDRARAGRSSRRTDDGGHDLSGARSTDRPRTSSGSGPRSTDRPRTSNGQGAGPSDRPRPSNGSSTRADDGRRRSAGGARPAARGERPSRDDRAVPPRRDDRGSRSAPKDAAPRRPARADAGLELDGGRRAPAADGGAASAAARRDKVRPSGAARRKVKREAMVAAGVTPERTKRKRSGAPRPAPSRRSS
ncbi:MAG: putative ATP-dependent helicase [Acidimicrobiales bacterium]|nr:putative ATP-dependent helicase [Acidimicrobiales bacterium]